MVLVFPVPGGPDICTYVSGDETGRLLTLLFSSEKGLKLQLGRRPNLHIPDMVQSRSSRLLPHRQPSFVQSSFVNQTIQGQNPPSIMLTAFAHDVPLGTASDETMGLSNCPGVEQDDPEYSPNCYHGELQMVASKARRQHRS